MKGAGGMQVTQKGGFDMTKVSPSSLLDGCGESRLTGSGDGDGESSCGWPVSIFAVSPEPAANSKTPSENGTRRFGPQWRRARHTVTSPGWLVSHIRGSRRLWLATASTVPVLLLAATAAAGVNQVQWTPKEMRAGVRALSYPRPHPRKIACHGLGPSTNGAYAGFKCNTAYRHHRHRAFYIGFGLTGGWLCAGKHQTGCRILPKGFITPRSVTQLGGLLAAAGYAATGYIQEHYNGTPIETGSPCTQTGTTPTFLCPYSSPAVTVRIVYRAVRGGWLITGS